MLTKAGFKFTATKQDDDTWSVVLDDQPISDLTPLKGAPIDELSLMRTKVSDLTPLRGMQIETLHLAGTPVTDLSPLAGMPLKSLQISSTAVSDLSPIRGMPMRYLSLGGCTNITDLGPLVGMTTLRTIVLPPNAKDFQFLRNFENLRRISFTYDPAKKGPAQTAVEFWAQQDQENKTAAAQ